MANGKVEAVSSKKIGFAPAHHSAAQKPQTPKFDFLKAIQKLNQQYVQGTAGYQAAAPTNNWIA